MTRSHLWVFVLALTGVAFAVVELYGGWLGLAVTLLATFTTLVAIAAEKE